MVTSIVKINKIDKRVEEAEEGVRPAMMDGLETMALF